MKHTKALKPKKKSVKKKPEKKKTRHGTNFLQKTAQRSSSGKKKLTKKQSRFVAALVNSKVDTIAEAARIAGLCDRAYGTRLIQQNTTIRETLQDYLDTLYAYGATKEVQAQRTAEELHATETKFFQHEGRVCDSREVVAWDVRHKALELLAKIHGYVQTAAKIEIDQSQKQLVLIIGSPEDSFFKQKPIDATATAAKSS